MAANRVVRLIGLLAIACCIALGQSIPAKPAAIFALQIHADHDTYKSGDGILVLVKRTNVSRKSDNYSIEGPPGSWYLMDVAYEGSPAEETDELKEILRPTPIDDPHVGSDISDIIPPGKSRTDGVPVTMYFKMTKPGQYAITFSQETFPGQPQKSRLVRSNTITVNVLHADNSSTKSSPR